MGISGIVIAFIKGWLMTFAMLAAIPAIVICKYLYSKLLIERSKIQQGVYAEAAGRA